MRALCVSMGRNGKSRQLRVASRLSGFLFYRAFVKSGTDITQVVTPKKGVEKPSQLLWKIRPSEIRLNLRRPRKEKSAEGREASSSTSSKGVKALVLQSVLRVTESFKVSHMVWRITHRRLNLGLSSGLMRVNKVSDEGALRNARRREVPKGLALFRVQPLLRVASISFIDGFEFE